MVQNYQFRGERLRLFRRMMLAACLGFVPTVLSSTAGAQAAKSYEFAIVSQPLSAALLRFSSLTGIDVAFDGSLPPNLRSAGISGNLPAELALMRLLAGTGLTYRFTTATTVF